MRIHYSLAACAFFLLGYLHEGAEVQLSFYHNLPNTNAVLLCSSLLGIASGKVEARDVAGVGIGLIIYEFMQLFIAERTFDVTDILFTVLGVGIFIGAIHWLKKFRTREGDQTGVIE